MFKRKSQPPVPITAFQTEMLIDRYGPVKAGNLPSLWTHINKTVAKAEKGHKASQGTVRFQRWWHTDTLEEFLKMYDQTFRVSESEEWSRLARMSCWSPYAGTNMGPGDHHIVRAELGIANRYDDGHPMRSRSSSGSRTATL